jgi:hypothetical protein
MQEQTASVSNVDYAVTREGIQQKQSRFDLYHQCALRRSLFIITFVDESRRLIRLCSKVTRR